MGREHNVEPCKRWRLTLPTLLVGALLLTHARPQTASSIDCCACTEASADDIEGSGECLAHCGFVIMRQAFDPAALTKYKVQWTEWFLGRDSTKYKGGRGPVLPRSHYLSYNDDGMLRGSRVHLVPPAHIPNEHLLYKKSMVEVYLEALDIMGLIPEGGGAG